MRLELLSALNRECAARRRCVLVTALDDGEQWLFLEGEANCGALRNSLKKRLRSGVSGVDDVDGRSYFVNVETPPLRLIIVGAVHVAQALAPMAQIAGFDVTVVDPRSAFAAKERFPDARVLAQWPGEALPAIGLDAFTALATLTHDPKIDDVALRAALRSECFYIGALGSKKTNARRVERLAAGGVDRDAIQRLHAPIGLDLGAASTAEIAVAVLAEIIQTWRATSTAKLEANDAPVVVAAN